MENFLPRRPISPNIVYKCQCTASIHKQVRFISLTSYEVRRISYCPCGASAANLATVGFFPSTPIEPGTVFAIDLLKLLHCQSVRGALSKYAWAEVLRAYFEEVKRAAIQPFFRPVSAYSPVTADDFFLLLLHIAYGRFAAMAYIHHPISPPPGRDQLMRLAHPLPIRPRNGR
jgi:hypothetical protein